MLAEKVSEVVEDPETMPRGVLFTRQHQVIFTNSRYGIYS